MKQRWHRGLITFSIALGFFSIIAPAKAWVAPMPWDPDALRQRGCVMQQGNNLETCALMDLKGPVKTVSYRLDGPNSKIRTIYEFSPSGTLTHVERHDSDDMFTTTNRATYFFDQKGRLDHIDFFYSLFKDRKTSRHFHYENGRLVNQTNEVDHVVETYQVTQEKNGFMLVETSNNYKGVPVSQAFHFDFQGRILSTDVHGGGELVGMSGPIACTYTDTASTTLADCVMGTFKRTLLTDKNHHALETSGKTIQYTYDERGNWTTAIGPPAYDVYRIIEYYP